MLNLFISDKSAEDREIFKVVFHPGGFSKEKIIN